MIEGNVPLAEYWYNKAQEQYDSGNSECALNFWIALSLGEIRAPYALYNCFANGIGVLRNTEIARFMFEIAKKLADTESEEKCHFIIREELRNQAWAIASLICKTRDNISLSGQTEMGLINSQTDMFNKEMHLPSGKSMYQFLTETSSILDVEDDVPVSGRKSCCEVS